MVHGLMGSMNNDRHDVKGYSMVLSNNDRYVERWAPMAPSRWRREVASDWKWLHVHACNQRIASKAWHKGWVLRSTGKECNMIH